MMNRTMITVTWVNDEFNPGYIAEGGGLDNFGLSDDREDWALDITPHVSGDVVFVMEVAGIVGEILDDRRTAEGYGYATLIAEIDEDGDRTGRYAAEAGYWTPSSVVSDEPIDIDVWMRGLGADLVDLLIDDGILE